MTDLLDPRFVEELEALRRHLSIRARSGAAGDRTARRRGGAAEFQEHRPYVPGDDLRRVDWLAFARAGEPVVKLFRTEEDSLVRLLIDTSASLQFGAPSKLDLAQRLAAGIGYMALAGSQRAQVIVTRPWATEPQGQQGQAALFFPPRRGRETLPALLRDLCAPSANTPAPTVAPTGSSSGPGSPRAPCSGGRADLARAIGQVIRTAPRPGLLVVLSDFLDRGAITPALEHARAAGHDVALLQVLDPSELSPPYEGDLSLVDAETGEAIDVTVDPDALAAYLERLSSLRQQLRAFARRHGAVYLVTTHHDPVDQVLRRFVARAID